MSTQEEMETNNENLDMIYDIVRKAGMKEGDELSIATDARVSLFFLLLIRNSRSLEKNYGNCISVE